MIEINNTEDRILTNIGIVQPVSNYLGMGFINPH